MKALDVDQIDVQYVADLARVELTSGETQRYQRELDAVVEYVHLLDELDVDGIEPTAHPFPVNNVYREDAARPGLPPECVERNAPAVTDDNAIRVPAILPGQDGA